MIVYEFLAGGDLGASIRSGAPAHSIERCLDIGIQVCAALGHAHRAGIIHGDLTPGNVLLDRDERVVLADFGMASLVSESSSALDGPDTLSGTAAYLPPERVTKEKLSLQTDLYGLGCLLYELVTGCPPFDDAAGTALLQRHHLELPRPPSARNAAVPTILSDLILQLLAKEPGRRPATSADVMLALEGIADGMVLDRAPQSLPIEDAEDRGRNVPVSGPIVGRRRELAVLDAALRSAEMGRCATLLLRGEPGIGKSRLLKHVQRQARSRGAIVLCADGRERDGARVSRLANLLRPMCGRLSDLDEEDARLIRRIVSTGIASNPADGGLREIEREYGNAIAAAARALLRFADGRLVVVAVDDLERADTATQHLFEDLAAAISRRPADVSTPCC